MYLNYQKLHMKCFKHMCKMYFWTVLLFIFVYCICFAQIINICIEIFVHSFTHTIQV